MKQQKSFENSFIEYLTHMQKQKDEIQAALSRNDTIHVRKLQEDFEERKHKSEQICQRGLSHIVKEKDLLKEENRRLSMRSEKLISDWNDSKSENMLLRQKLLDMQTHFEFCIEQERDHYTSLTHKLQQSEIKQGNVLGKAEALIQYESNLLNDQKEKIQSGNEGFY